MTTDGVTRRYELTAARAVLLDVISSNITDPLTGQEARSATTEWIFNGMPEKDRLGQGSGGYKYPIVVFDFSDIDAEVKTVDKSKQMITHSFSIEVHSRTRLQANELSEQIKYILDVTGLSELNKGTLHITGINGSSNDIDFLGGNKVYIKTIDYGFQRFD